MLAVFMLLSASQGLAQILGERFAGREYRAVWLTTLSGLDWPSRPVSVPSDTLRQQQALRQTLDRLQQAGINTVIFQTRIRATVAYPSSIEPWDGAFSGTPGRGTLGSWPFPSAMRRWRGGSGRKLCQRNIPSSAIAVAMPGLWTLAFQPRRNTLLASVGKSWNAMMWTAYI